MDEDFVTPAVVAEITGLNKRTLAGLRYQAGGPRFYKPTKKIVLYRRSEVIAWVEASVQLRSVATVHA